MAAANPARTACQHFRVTHGLQGGVVRIVSSPVALYTIEVSFRRHFSKGAKDEIPD